MSGSLVQQQSCQIVIQNLPEKDLLPHRKASTVKIITKLLTKKLKKILNWAKVCLLAITNSSFQLLPSDTRCSQYVVVYKMY